MTPFRLKADSSQSIFDQVVYAATKAILSGALKPGEPFPSVRTMAADLKIHPNTAHKVIQHLIQERWLIASPGRGNGLIALHGWIDGIAFVSRWLWRILCWIDAGMLLWYALLLAQAEGGPPVWSLILVEALLFAPMLFAMHRYGWRSPAIWPDDFGAAERRPGQ